MSTSLGGVAKNPFFKEYPWIGVPEKYLNPSDDDYKSAYASRIGGKAVWLNEKHLEIAVVDPNDINEEETVEVIRKKMIPEQPSKKSLTCQICSSPMYLVCQAYAPLGHFDRFLYLFGCNNRLCRNANGSWAAYRVQYEVYDGEVAAQQQQEEEQAKQEKPLIVDNTDASVLKESQKEWKLEENLDDQLQNLLAMQNQKPATTTSTSANSNKKKKKNKKKKAKTVVQDIPKYSLPCYLLDIFEEPESESEDEEDDEDQDSKAKAMMEGKEDYNEEELAAFGKQMTTTTQTGRLEMDDVDDEEPELGEDDKDVDATLVNPTFLKFQETLEKVPNQSVRWQFGGEPLWIIDHPSTLPNGYSVKRDTRNGLVRVGLDEDDDDDDEDQIKSDYTLRPNISPYVPKCPTCGSARVFELEILPTIIYQLKPGEHCHREGEDQGMEFGTVTVYTCSGQCSGRSEQELQKNPHKLKYVKEYVHVQPGL